jgi:hypothetical protein
MDRLALEGRSTHEAFPPWAERLLPDQANEWLRESVVGGEVVRPILLQPENEAALRRAQPGGLLNQSLENRLQIKGRTADGPQEIAGHHLLLEGLQQFAIPGLGLLKQAGVLQGDGTVPGKGRHQLDLPVAEFPRLPPEDAHGTDDPLAMQERHDENRPVSPAQQELSADIVRGCMDIGDLRRNPLDDRAHGQGAGSQGLPGA